MRLLRHFLTLEVELVEVLVYCYNLYKLLMFAIHMVEIEVAALPLVLLQDSVMILRVYDLN